MAERVITVEFSATDLKTVKEVKEKIQKKVDDQKEKIERQNAAYASSV